MNIEFLYWISEAIILESEWNALFDYIYPIRTSNIEVINYYYSI